MDLFRVQDDTDIQGTSFLFQGGEGVIVWTMNVQNALKGGFGLSQEGYSVTSLQ